MRKALAGKLIRLAHFIYPPRVTEESNSFRYFELWAGDYPPDRFESRGY